MNLFLQLSLFALLGGVLSVFAASLFLLLSDRVQKRIVPKLISFAIGALLGAAFLVLLPHALEPPSELNAHVLGILLLAGILGFFILEKWVLWRHCHTHRCEVHTYSPERFYPQTHDHQAAGTLILIGDSLHNFMDGILIAAAFFVDPHVGMLTALAVAAHEIPQELGDFVILLESQFSKRKALLFNVLSSLATLLGAWVAYFLFQSLMQLHGYFIAIAAASFIYVAVADLIPPLHKHTHWTDSMMQLVLILLGVMVIWGSHQLMH